MESPEHGQVPELAAGPVRSLGGLLEYFLARQEFPLGQHLEVPSDQWVEPSPGFWAGQTITEIGIESIYSRLWTKSSKNN